MIYLISGASHTGKTLLSQKLLEKIGVPYTSIDHIKMGLIRSGLIDATPQDEEKLTAILWPVIREMIKTATENKQNMIIDGCYIPFDWKNDFSEEYLRHIRYICIVFSKSYIENNFNKIIDNANVIEARLDDFADKSWLKQCNEFYLNGCKKAGLDYLLIDNTYSVNEISDTAIKKLGALGVIPLLRVCLFVYIQS